MTSAAVVPEDMMVIEAARWISDDDICFVGIGLPSLAVNLARHTHAPHARLIYESGPIGSKPTTPPLSIGDGELAETADFNVSVPEMFSYWLQGGRIDVGFLGAAQIDPRGNLNSTVIGDYDRPKVRLPGAGGAPEIATNVRDVFVLIKHTPKTLVANLDFLSSSGRNVRAVITDIGVLEPSGDGTLALTAIHNGVSVEQVGAATGWNLAIANDLRTTAQATEQESSTLNSLRRIGST
jgi:glutaconate CoA-transferase subunit B